MRTVTRFTPLTVIAFFLVVILVSGCEFTEGLREAKKAMERMTEKEFQRQFEDMARQMEEEMKKAQKRGRDGSSAPGGKGNVAGEKLTRNGVLVLESGGSVRFFEIINLSSVRGMLRERDVRIPFSMIYRFDIVARNGGCVWYHSDKGDFSEPCRIKVELNDGRYFVLEKASIQHRGDREHLGDCVYRAQDGRGGPDDIIHKVDMENLKSVRFQKS